MANTHKTRNDPGNPSDSSMHMLSTTALPEGMSLDTIGWYLGAWQLDDASLSKALLIKDSAQS